MKIKGVLFLAAALTSLTFLSCSKNDADGGSGTTKARMQVYLTDDPGAYQAVYIDVQDVRINYSTDSAQGWQSLPNVKRGQYDLLTLTNDKDTLLSEAELNTGRIEQMRLVLGPNNFVKVNNEIKPLEAPSAEQSGLKLNIHQDIKSGILYKVLLDFDVAKSIRQTGNGKYMLKPVIRTVLDAIGGSLQGYVSPSNIPTAVLAIQGQDTVASTYTYNGGYLLKGLGAGSYLLRFVPSDSTYKTQSKSGISVTVNNVTRVDTVYLQH